MNNLQIFVLYILIVTITVPVRSNPHHGDDSRLGPSDIGKFIIKITDILSRAIESGEEAIEIFNNKVDKFQELSVRQFVEALEHFEKVLEENFNTSEELDKDGIELYKCVSNNKKTINSALMSYWDGFTKCLNPSIKNATFLLSPILEELNKTDAKVADSAKHLNDCGLIDITCLVSVALDIVNLIEQLPEALIPKAMDIEKYVESLWPTAQMCSETATSEWIKNGFEQLGVIAKCIGEKTPT